MSTAIKESEERFKDLIEKANIGIHINDCEGNITYFNRKFAEMFGYSQREMKKRKIQALVHPDDIERVMKFHRERLPGTKAPLRFEFKGVRKDGSVIYLEEDAAALKRGGNVTGTHSYIWDITRRKKLEEGHESALAKLRIALKGFVLALAKSVEERDPFTSDHQQRVAGLARAIAEEMGLPKKKIDGILMAGIIHDIGKIKVPAEILNKTSKITKTELEIIKIHPKVGYDILKNIAFPWPIAQIIFQHHERMDGSGYPQGLKGDEILLESRVLAIADVVEAFASHRPYRAALGIEAAIEEISQNKGRLYDSDAVDACLRVLGEKKFQFKIELNIPWKKL